MKNIILLICVITALSIQAQKINWNNVGPFPIEEKGGIIFYNIDGEKWQTPTSYHLIFSNDELYKSYKYRQ